MWDINTAQAQLLVLLSPFRSLSLGGAVIIIIIIIMYTILCHFSIQDRAHGPLQSYIDTIPRKYSTDNHIT